MPARAASKPDIFWPVHPCHAAPLATTDLATSPGHSPDHTSSLRPVCRCTPTKVSFLAKSDSWYKLVLPFVVGVLLAMAAASCWLRWRLPSESANALQLRLQAANKQQVTLVLTDAEAWKELYQWNPSVSLSTWAAQAQAGQHGSDSRSQSSPGLARSEVLLSRCALSGHQATHCIPFEACSLCLLFYMDSTDVLHVPSVICCPANPSYHQHFV